MTEQMFFDTDCISSFLWVGREDIILFRYKGRVIVPQFVYDELCRPGVNHLRIKVDNMIAAKLIQKMNIMLGSDASRLFRELTRSPLNGRAVIGKGEASALVLAKEHGGIVASNNLKDVKLYIDDFGLSLKTTADILVEAFSDQFLNESDANIIWADMIKKRRKMPACSFSEYLRML